MRPPYWLDYPDDPRNLQVTALLRFVDGEMTAVEFASMNVGCFLEMSGTLPLPSALRPLLDELVCHAARFLICSAICPPADDTELWDAALRVLPLVDGIVDPIRVAPLERLQNWLLDRAGLDSRGRK